jgi:hypothetical protein
MSDLSASDALLTFHEGTHFHPCMELLSSPLDNGTHSMQNALGVTRYMNTIQRKKHGVRSNTSENKRHNEIFMEKFVLLLFVLKFY